MRTAQDIILKPVITEDSMDRLQANRYTFKVAKDANKIEIAKAVEELFNVKVAKVNTISVKGKQKRMGRSVGYRPDWKKRSLLLRVTRQSNSSRLVLNPLKEVQRKAALPEELHEYREAFGKVLRGGEDRSSFHRRT